MVNNSFSSTAELIWSVAELIRGEFRRSEYGLVILPFTILRRLECVLEATKPQVLAKFQKEKSKSEGVLNSLLTHEAKLSFYNTSKMDLNRLGETDVARNLESYIHS